jgi:anthranilate phosphoribosyltransferase
VLLSGEKSPKRDAAILNAGAAMYVSGRYDSIREAVDAASKIIDSGAAAAKLEAFIEGSNT